jgi:epoxyqueuosine reductase
MNEDRTSERIVQTCLAMGFADAGVCAAEPSRWEQEFRAWLAAGKAGSMEWLADTADARLSVDSLLQGAASIIMVADQYAEREGRGDAEFSAAAQAVPADDAAGRIARYARGGDYHAVIRRRLHALCDRLREEHPGAAFRTFIDAAPVMEREHAARAGLGFIGKHTLLIHPTRGSYVLLGGIATTLTLAPLDGTGRHTGDLGCGSCTRCIDACPTRAISPYSVDASRCISYLTIERRPAIPAAMHESIGDMLLGCDICQEVCPFNAEDDDHHAAAMRNANPAYYRDRRLPLLSAREVLSWSAAARASALSGAAIKRATLSMIMRNAVIVIGNAACAARLSGDVARAATLRAVLEQVRHSSDDDLVTSTAADALARLNAAS